MKTLIINGSTSRGGDTEALIETLIQHLDGEVKVVTHRDCISPCIDCRRCRTSPGCSIDDGMQEIYKYFDECDNVVIASPVWYASLSGPTLDIASRFQTYFAERYFREEARHADKGGLIILTGGMPGTEASAVRSAKIIFMCIGVRKESVAVVVSMNTDKLPASEDTAAQDKLIEAARMLNIKHAR